MSITEPGNRDLPLTARYHALKKNGSPLVVERADRGTYRRLTSENWQRYLIANVSIVEIPVSMSTIHRSIIEEYGHDRVVELRFTGSIPYRENDTQLNFTLIGKSAIGLDLDDHVYARLACRVSGLDTYDHAMYLRRSAEDVERDQLRMRLVGWRRAIYRRQTVVGKRILNANPFLNIWQQQEIFRRVCEVVPGLVCPPHIVSSKEP